MGRKRKADAAEAPAAEEKPEEVPVEDEPEEDKDETDNDDAEEEADDGAGDAPPVKKGRGRPPKAGGPAKAAAKSAAADEGGAKRGRGRPRKAVERLEYTSMTSGRPSRRSERVREINSPGRVVYRGSSSGASVPSGSALELRRLTVEQKRLNLERERFAVEQERLEMDRNNWDRLHETLTLIANNFGKDGLSKMTKAE